MKTMRIPWEKYEITVYTHGSGDIPLLLLHGGGLDSAMLSWREVMQIMPETYATYAIDLPGYGQSARPEDLIGECFYPRMISVVERVVDVLGLKSFALSGLSMGGAIAIGYALLHPERVGVLIPLDSWGLVNRMPLQGLWVAYTKSSINATCFRLFARHRWLVRWSMSSLIGNKSKITNALIDEVFALCQMPGAERSMQDFQRSSLTRHGTVPDYTRRFTELAMPVMYLCGEKDILVRVKDCVRAASATPLGRAYILKGCRHWAQKEKPQDYVQVADAFIMENSRLLNLTR